tara:strand:- start:343 stop:1770 length:1428 start_codon:yes stop_codon:yes gene_type:complete
MGLLDGTTQASYYQGSNFGNYQFVSLEDIINQFMVAYIGEDKIVTKASRTDVSFHAQRALAELSFDTLKSIKSYEIDLPPSLTMILPHDYVNYVKLTWGDEAGVEHVLYPAIKTSNPVKITQQDSGNYDFGPVAGNELVINNDFSDPFATPWHHSYINPNSPSDPDTISISNGQLAIGTNPFAYSGSFPGRVYAVWQEIDVTGLDFVTISASGTSASAESNKSEAGLLRFGLSTIPGDNDTNPYNTNNPTDNINPPDIAYLEWNAGDDTAATQELTNVDVSAYNSVYVLITSRTVFSDVTAVTSTNYIDDISVKSETALHDLQTETSDTWLAYKGATPRDNINKYDDGTYDLVPGERYGIHPQYAQVNGSFFIDELKGNIHFSSNLSGKNIILKYISDSLGTDGEMQVHKLAEDAMYKWMLHAILSTRANTPEYVVQRFKKEKFAAVRKAKLRLSNIKLEELTQVLRGKSKRIKH